MSLFTGNAEVYVDREVNKVLVCFDEPDTTDPDTGETVPGEPLLHITLSADSAQDFAGRLMIAALELEGESQ